jgi:hypothetical protein
LELILIPPRNETKIRIFKIVFTYLNIFFLSIVGERNKTYFMQKKCSKIYLQVGKFALKFDFYYRPYSLSSETLDICTARGAFPSSTNKKKPEGPRDPLQCCRSRSGLDPDSTWIRIRIRIRYPDPNPGGQK